MKRCAVKLSGWLTTRLSVFAALIVLGALASCTLGPPGSVEGPAPEPEVDPANLPRIPPVEPDDALSTFQVREGFRVELVAAEPLVADPIAMAFDEEGRLFVVEMRYYPEIDTTGEKVGRIRLLEDTTGDGRFDKSTVYADQLRWPTAVICFDGGVFVAATPDLLYLKDTTGDGIADVHEVAVTGFGTEGRPAFFVQQMPNSFTWGLDNRIHGATSGNGGKVTRVDGRASSEDPIDLAGRDFSFDPRSLHISTESGGSQHGLSFDDDGRKYVNRQSSHIQLLMYEARYADRNAAYVMPPVKKMIADDGGPAEVYRISEHEPWRQLRTRWTVEGLLVRDENQNLEWQAPGGDRRVWEGGIGYDGGSYITSASGITIYRGDAWPDSFRGDAFIGEPAGNLVHRKTLYPDGVGVRARRAPDELNSEFLASTDNWFRPVQFANGPDGTLYVADMYREIIDLPSGIPSPIQRHLDLKSGNDRGRIYRIVPDGFNQPDRPRLANYSTTELVATLEHTNGWHRDTAARLLYERQDEASIPLLESLLEQSTSSLGRLHALYALDGQQALSRAHLLAAMGDSDATVRKHAVRLSEGYIGSDSNRGNDGNRQIVDRLLNLADDPDPEVRYQLAFTLGEIEHPGRAEALTNILRRNADNEWIHAAILSSLSRGAGEMFGHVITDATLRNSTGGGEFLRKLTSMIGTQNEPSVVDDAIAYASGLSDEATVFALVTSLGTGLQHAGSSLNRTSAPELERIFQRAAAVAQDGTRSDSTRVRAIRLFGFSSMEQAIPTLVSFLGPDEPQMINLAALEALNRDTGAEIADKILEKWPVLTPRVRREALTGLLTRPDRITPLLNALEVGIVAGTELASTQIRFLRSHSNSSIRERARQVLGDGGRNERQRVIDAYASVLELDGDASKGFSIYRDKCASCHRFGDEGYAMGPDVASLGTGGRGKLLVDIIDPNRDVSPTNLLYTVVTDDGESLMGVIANETATSVTLRSAFGREDVLLRSNIAEVLGSEQSMMPEGLEAGLSEQDMADLLEFIVTAGNN